MYAFFKHVSSLLTLILIYFQSLISHQQQPQSQQSASTFHMLHFQLPEISNILDLTLQKHNNSDTYNMQYIYIYIYFFKDVKKETLKVLYYSAVVWKKHIKTN